jgi:predicted O-linked N-acetylglucosamine transferase (SPINDLY family)
MPDSRLLLKALLLRDAAAQRRVRERFAEHGIAPERLELRGATNDRASHLAAYGEIDIALDSFPYNGTATTCEALWMGVPVVTWAGDRHSARVGHSLLGHAGLGELVRRDRRGYVDCAIGLARDLSGLAGLRAGLRPRIAASPLCDGPGFARAFETALRRMWTDWSQR